MKFSEAQLESAVIELLGKARLLRAQALASKK